MKPDVLPDPERWSERTGGDAAEDAIGASLRSVRAATEPSAVASTRWARLAMAPAAATAVRSGPRLLAAALTATLLVGSGAAAGVAWHAHAVRSAATRAPGADVPAEARAPHAAQRRAITSPLQPSPAAEVSPPVETPLPDALEPTPAPAPTGARKLARVALPPAITPPRSALEPPPLAAVEGDDEARLLARAFRHLRSEGDAAGAIAALDEHDRRFGAGALATEAALARVEALLLLGRSTEALPPLLAIRGTPAGRTPEVRATRAELLARAHRCDEAASDLDALLAPGAPAAARARALYARASCALEGGDPARALPDLERYLGEFPDGRSAPAVRAALERLRRP
jgi:hypothetical protein